MIIVRVFHIQCEGVLSKLSNVDIDRLTCSCVIISTLLTILLTNLLAQRACAQICIAVHNLILSTDHTLLPLRARLWIFYCF